MTPAKKVVPFLPSVWTLCVMYVCSSTWAAIITDTNKGTCNPKADMVFVLNGNTSISKEHFQKQKDFVRDVVTNHSSPPGAVHVGIIVCSDGNITKTVFMKSKQEILTSLKSIEKPVSLPNKNRKRDCIASLRKAYTTRERYNTARTALFVIGEEGHWSKRDTNSLKVETEKERISLLIVGVGIQNFAVLNAIQGIVSDKRKFYVLPSYLGLKRLSVELTTGPCLPMSLEEAGPVTSQPITTLPLPTLSFNKRCRELLDGRMYIREIPFLGWQRQTCPENTRIDTSDCKCRIPTQFINRTPEVTSIVMTEELTQSPKKQLQFSTTLEPTTSSSNLSSTPDHTTTTAITSKQSSITSIVMPSLQNHVSVDERGLDTRSQDMTTKHRSTTLTISTVFPLASLTRSTVSPRVSAAKSTVSPRVSSSKSTVSPRASSVRRRVSPHISSPGSTTSHPVPSNSTRTTSVAELRNSFTFSNLATTTKSPLINILNKLSKISKR